MPRPVITSPQRKILMAVPTDSTATGSPAPVSLPQLAGERNGLGGLLVGLARAETISVHTVRSASPRQSDACGPRVRRPGMRDDPCAAGGERSRARAAASD